MRYLTISTILCLFWVLLSGHFTPLLLGMGAASVLLVVWLVRRMDRVDGEASWVVLSFGLFRYTLWLLWSVIKASIDVVRCVWNPALPICPSWTRLDTGIETPLKKTLYANSITLTPGTLTTNAHEDHLVVHSLNEHCLAELHRGVMESRIRRLVL